MKSESVAVESKRPCSNLHRVRSRMLISNLRLSSELHPAEDLEREAEETLVRKGTEDENAASVCGLTECRADERNTVRDRLVSLSPSL